MELGRRLGVKQPTAWAVKHKIHGLRVEMDDVGGVRSGGKRGRGAAGKTPFVAASPPRGARASWRQGFRKREIARGAKHLAPGAAVVTDGLGCWSALDECHRAIRTGSGRQAAHMASFKWVNNARQHASSAPTMPDAISPASPGATTSAINSKP